MEIGHIARIPRAVVVGAAVMTTAAGCTVYYDAGKEVVTSVPAGAEMYDTAPDADSHNLDRSCGEVPAAVSSIKTDAFYAPGTSEKAVDATAHRFSVRDLALKGALKPPCGQGENKVWIAG